ncbi:MAG TPA: hypothetical protein VNT60_03240, partial [Deinococcales bacterium]|nr:hypothetical protein [Deinococcales bacterium]
MSIGRAVRNLTVLALLAVIALSPSVVRAVTSLALLEEARGEAAAAPALAVAQPADSTALVTPELVAAWAPKAAAYGRVLEASGIGGGRSARLLEGFWVVFSQSAASLGLEVASAAADLLVLEARASAVAARASAYPTPEASLAASERWLDFIRLSRRIVQLTPRSKSVRSL